MSHEALLSRLTAAFADVPGVAAIVLGGSRARGSAHAASDQDIGLYFRETAPLDTKRLQTAAKAIGDVPSSVAVTDVGAWVVGGAWLSVDGHKVDLLYRNVDAVEAVMESCRAGIVTMDYQPGHPHGFCSAIWMGEVACCLPLHDPQGLIGRLQSIAHPYPPALREALIRRFHWEVLFGVENAALAALRGEQTHVAGCLYRSLACVAQLLFALNERYLINEKGALQEAATLPRTIPNLAELAREVWRLVGAGALGPACDAMCEIERNLRTPIQSVGTLS